jgi:hypothetical protein
MAGLSVFVRTAKESLIVPPYKAYVDVWNRIMGMRQQIAYSQNASKPVQNTADNHKCALVCD